MIEIALQAAAEQYQPGEDLAVQVRLHNNGAATGVANPAALRAQPRWRLSLLPDVIGRVITNRQGFAPPTGQPEQLSLGSGETWNGTVSIAIDGPALAAGHWALSLLLEVDGVVQESPPCVLSVAPWSIVQGDAGFGVPPFGKGQGDTLLLQGTGSGPKLMYRMAYQEIEGDRPPNAMQEPILLQSVAGDASDPLVPVRDGPFWGDPARWLLWREGPTVHALDTAGRVNSLTLPEAPAVLFRPALQRTGGDITVVALSNDRHRLLQLRFPRTPGDAPELVAVADLPAAPASGTVALAGDGVRIALTAAAPNATRLLVLDPTDATAARIADVDGFTPVPNAPPALQWSATGEAQVAALVSRQTEIALADARFPADASAPPEVSIRPLGRFAARPVAGALLYERSINEPPHLVQAVVRLDDGTMLHLVGTGMLAPTGFEAPPVPPLALAPAHHGAFILCCDPITGPIMAQA